MLILNLEAPGENTTWVGHGQGRQSTRSAAGARCGPATGLLGHEWPGEDTAIPGESKMEYPTDGSSPGLLVFR